MTDFNWPPTTILSISTVRIEDTNGNPIIEGQTTMANSLPVVIASDQTPIPVTVSSLPTTSDTNYGTPTASTLRTASMLGMGSTAVSATNPVFVELSNGVTTYNAPSSTQLPAALGQTTEAGSLSVTIASNQSSVAVTPANTVITPLFVEPGNGVNSYTSAAITAAQFTESTAAAVPVTAGLAMGWDGTTHREISVTTSGVVNTTGSVTLGYDENFGTPTATTLRTASMLGMGSTAVSASNPVFCELSNGATAYSTNTATQLPAALGQNTMANSLTVAIASNQSSIPVSNLPTTADTNYGTPGASTLRTASMLGMGSTAVSVTNPVFVEPGNGTNSFASAAITAAQFTQSTATAVPVTAGLAMGWDGTTHREIAVTTTGLLQNTTSGLALQGSATIDTSATNISTTYVQLVASTSAAVSWVSVFNGSGSVLQLGVGTAGSEVLVLIVPPGGIESRLTIAAGQRVAIKQTSIGAAMTSGFLTINLMG
jgi:fructose/tagatose bisphosphate aldolase